MFSSKKNFLPLRPRPPDIKKILKDLENSTNTDDVSFKLMAKESAYKDRAALCESNDLNNLNNVYEKVKTYFTTNVKLKLMKDTIHKHEFELQANVNNMIKLTEEIKDQAQAALVYYS